MTGNPPLIVILGPTAVGKTGLAMAMAAALDGEIVGADSRQTYRYMDIGTAKPTLEQQRSIPHHLIDIVNPDENLSVAEYQRLAYAAIDAIHERGRLPLLVGGTGQYITAVVEGWSIPEVPPNPTLRAELEAYAAVHGAEALHRRLHSVDPAAALRTDYRNVRRVVRALEIVMETGQAPDYAKKDPPPYAILQLGLTMERAQLNERADRRIDQMMAAGFLDEVRRLLAMGYTRDVPSMSGLGYRELAANLSGECTLDDAIAATKRATRDFIRRQQTWFRGHDQGIHWIDVETTPPSQIIDLMTRWLAAQEA